MKQGNNKLTSQDPPTDKLTTRMNQIRTIQIGAPQLVWEPCSWSRFFRESNLRTNPLDNEKPSFAEFLHPSRIYFRYNGLKGGVESAHALNALRL